MFLPWNVWRTRGRALTLTLLRQHPDYGPRLRELADPQMEAVLDIAGEVLRRLTPGLMLTPELRDAITAGVCVQMAGRTAEEIAVVLRDRVSSDGDLTDLGIPASLQPALRSALGRKADDWGHAE